MTVENVQHSTEVAGYDPNNLAGLGLEDATISDIVIPRLRIMHAEGRFQNNLTKEEFEKLNVILLGLVKQRIMWHEEVEDDDRPMCKSPNFEWGFPNDDENTKKDKRFPWDESNFNPSDFPADKGINGFTTLPCASCRFKEWSADRKPPKCSEQHTYPLLYSTPDDPDSWMPALFTVQRTGIKPSRSYLSSFVQAKKPMFTVYTELGLTQHSRGSVKYCIPTFRQTSKTDPDFWQDYGNTFIGIRDFVKAAPRPAEDDEESTPTSNTNSAPAPAATPAQTPVAAAPTQAAPPPPAPAQPAQSAPATAEADDDDLPF